MLKMILSYVSFISYNLVSSFSRPAYMDEYEKLEEELKKVYEVSEIYS